MATSSRLCHHGALSDDIRHSLAAHRITTVSGLLSATPSEISDITGLKKASVTELRDVLLSEYGAVPYLSYDGCQVCHDDAETTTRLIRSYLDNYLPSGSLKCGELTELYGTSSSGKTQLCLRVASAFCAKKFKVAYVDTDGSFSGLRILDMLGDDVEPSNEESLLENVHIFRVFNEADLVQALERILYATIPYKLVIVDSVASVLVPILSRAHSLGNAILTQIGRLMLKIARQRNAFVLCTNYGHTTGKGELEKPAMGVVWAHIPSARVHVKRSCPLESSSRKTTLVKSTGFRTGTQVVFDVQ
eukprot:m.215010 g.215010  ORF g.215010 m.215010 type:complete len:304 (-) comp19083_c0_seq2:3429-4340(-)